MMYMPLSALLWEATSAGEKVWDIVGGWYVVISASLKAKVGGRERGKGKVTLLKAEICGGGAEVRMECRGQRYRQ